jgi:hypothetical protein
VHGSSGPIVVFKKNNYARFELRVPLALIQSHYLNRFLLLNELTSMSMIRSGSNLQPVILVSISVIQGEGC